MVLATNSAVVYLVLLSVAVSVFSKPGYRMQSLLNSRKYPRDQMAVSEMACNSNNKFHCSSDTCIPGNQRCDGHNDCRDGDDEDDCECPSLSGDTSKCLDGTCIQWDQKCNGPFDCTHGEDELHCGCDEDEFMCVHDGNCIPNSWRCDRFCDCSDLSDEMGCPGIHSCFHWPWGTSQEKDMTRKTVKQRTFAKESSSLLREEAEKEKEIAEKLYNMLTGKKYHE